MAFDYSQYMRPGKLPHIWCPGCAHGVVMKSIISALGGNFFEGTMPNVEFIKDNLPPRTQFGFRITEIVSQQERIESLGCPNSMKKNFGAGSRKKTTRTPAKSFSNSRIFDKLAPRQPKID